jgi:hypothetical protein
VAGAGEVLDILGVCGVDRGLVVSELVPDCGSVVRDLRLVGFLVVGSWVASRISYQRVW